ncbi:MAG: MG2 domain-containing protein [Chthoniobacterales bacterium]
MKLHRPLLLAAASLFGHAATVTGQGIEMFPASGDLQPASTVEFRFPVPMVAPDALGPVAAAPFVFEPALPGQFTWLSTRSGVFQPQGPLPPGTTWEVRSRPGLTEAGGRTVDSGFRTVLRTPAFGVTAVQNGVWNPQEVSADVTVRIGFNLPVTPDAKFFVFTDAAGRTAAAQVRHATAADYFDLQPEADDWAWRALAAADPASAAATRTEFPARLMVEPLAALPAGPGWQLRIEAGLPDAGGQHRLATPLDIPLGTVPPFTLRTVEAGNYINSGPTLYLEFTAALAPDINEENAAEFITIDPAPPDFRWEISYGTAVARGRFELGRDYAVTIGDGVFSSIGQAFDGPRRRTVRFAPVPPRLHLPELTMSQILGGRRLLPVRSVNLSSLRVRAVLLPPDQAARALSAFTTHEWKYRDGQPVPEVEFTGRNIADETIPLTNPAIDRRQTTDLDWTRLLGGTRAGVIYLKVEGSPLDAVGGPKPAAQAIIQLTDLGVLWKKTGRAIRTLVFSNATAQPAAGTTVTLLDGDFKTLSEAPVEADGQVTLDYAATPAWLLARRGDDTCIVRLGPRAQSLPLGQWFFANWDVTNDPPGELRASFFTDRPLYQPGETARIKGYLRRFGADGPAFVPDREVNLVLRNPNFDELQRLTVTTDAAGAFTADLPLPAGPLGSYYLQLETAGLEGGASVPVLLASYQPDAFEASLAVPERIAAGDQPPAATVSGQYFFGGRVTDAEVRWTLRYFRAPFAPPGFDRFEFLDPREEDEPKPLTLRGEGAIIGGTPLTIEPVLPAADLAPYRGLLTAEVTDLNQQTVSRTAEFTREASDFYLGVTRPGERVVRTGDEVALDVIAVRPDGEVVTTPVEVAVEILRSRYNVVRELGAGGAMTFRRETIEEPVFTGRTRTVTPVRKDGQWTTPETGSLRYQTEDLGHHRVRVTARDSAGREVASESSFFVAGAGETVWDYDSPYRIQLVPDKESYSPGEIARVLVQTPMAGEAIVSIERGESILRTLRLSLEGNAPVIDVPLALADAPGVTVSLVLLRGSDDSKRKFPTTEFRYGSCVLSVEDPAARLRVEVAPQSPRVQPGEEVAATVAVRDSEGRPVPRAGVTFYAVDDGVLALTGFKLPDPAEIFLAPVTTRVLTGLSLADLVPEDPDDVVFGNKGYLIGGGGEGGPVSLRENFPGTACWLPALVTGDDGTVTARFTAPDALTRYRLVAVAAAGPAAFGSGESAVAIARPLMILPSLGAFANTGDRLVARAVVRNETGQDGTVEVALRTPVSTETVTLEIPHGASRAADFTLAFKQTGDLDLEWSATMAAGGRTFSDGARTVLSVGSPMLRLRETYFAELGAGRTNLLDGVNPQIGEGRGRAAVAVSNTRLSALGAKARFLVAYPYGCAEQRASSMVPWLLMPALGPLMPGFAADPAEAERVIKKTIVQLLDQQQPDGGLSFWAGGRTSDLFPSAWAAIVLSLAGQREFKLPAAWNGLLDYLAKSLRGLSPETPAPLLAERAFAAYALALAGRAEASYHEELYRRRADLSAGSRAVLALAVMQAKGPRDMVATLLADTAAPDDFSPFGGTTREQALQLLAWTNFRPADPAVPQLVAELLALGPQQRVATTQGNAWALLALTSYYMKIEKPAAGDGAAPGAITAGPQTENFDVTARAPVFRRDFPLAPGAALTVENARGARLYAETEFDVFPPLGQQPAQDRGFTVSRAYAKIGPDGALQPAEDLRVGDRVIVTLRLETTRPAYFVALDDPLPSILEAVNPAFVSRATGETVETSDAFVSHRETRADRVLYFCDALPPGSYTFRYLARVRVAGQATAGATKAEAMYRPDRFGLGTIAQLESRP